MGSTNRVFMRRAGAVFSSSLKHPARHGEKATPTAGFRLGGMSRLIFGGYSEFLATEPILSEVRSSGLGTSLYRQ